MAVLINTSTRVLRQSAAVALVLSAPAYAQATDHYDQLIEAYLSCFLGAGDAAAVTTSLGEHGWTYDPPQEGLIVALPSTGETAFALIAEDGSYCHAESMEFGTEKVTELLALSMLGVEIELPPPVPGDDGCDLYDLGQGITATVNGGDTPGCSSDSTSAVLFRFAP